MTYADDFNLRDKYVATLDDIADAIDGLVWGAVGQGAYGTLISTNSTSYVDMTSVTCSVAVATDQDVLLAMWGNWSCDTANKTCYFAVAENSTEYTGNGELNYMQATNTQTDGLEDTFVTFFVDTSPTVGTNTYKGRYCTTSAATVYIRRANIIAIPYYAA